MVQHAAGVHPGWGAPRAAPRPAGPASAPRVAPSRLAAPRPAARGFRVEHRDEGAAVVLGHLPAGVPQHHATLAPYASHLRLAGRASGEVALVDEATGAVVARRHLRHLGPRRR